VENDVLENLFYSSSQKAGLSPYSVSFGKQAKKTSMCIAEIVFFRKNIECQAMFYSFTPLQSREGPGPQSPKGWKGCSPGNQFT